METKPLLIVFDLDYTLWPFWVDTHVSPPFKKQSNGKVVDNRGRKVKLYPQSLKILQHLHKKNYTLAIASRTGATEDAEELLTLFQLNKYFSMKQIYPGRKTAHFAMFHNTLKMPYANMLFFDDEQRNIRDLSEIGVTCVLVEDGMTFDCLKKGLQLHEEKMNALTKD